MKKFILVLITLTICQFTIAQAPKAQNPPPQNEDFIELPDPATNSKGNKKDKVLQVAEQMPEFVGGEDALLKYLGSNLKYPAIARDANTQGTIYITFVINKKGRVENVQLLRGLNGPGATDCANEGIRVIKGMPKWKPGKHKGKTVSVQYNLPIKFTLR
ncbi:MAG: energy transducer TonB [Sphingobacteriales bacterium JAD_PAG50586_3]|nr:MAG: energy transducer TonB [Sphingobacteriales bacterium JAD_PAG50586_3]